MSQNEPVGSTTREAIKKTTHKEWLFFKWRIWGAGGKKILR